MQKQRGISLSGLLFVAVLVAFFGAAALKLLPDVLDYLAIVKDIKATAQDPTLREASPADIRRAFDRRILIDNVSGIYGSDLDIIKQGTDITINVAYQKKVPLFRNVSLVIDFEGSSAK